MVQSKKSENQHFPQGLFTCYVTIIIGTMSHGSLPVGARNFSEMSGLTATANSLWTNQLTTFSASCVFLEETLGSYKSNAYPLLLLLLLDHRNISQYSRASTYLGGDSDRNRSYNFSDAISVHSVQIFGPFIVGFWKEALRVNTKCSSHRACLNQLICFFISFHTRMSWSPNQFHPDYSDLRDSGNLHTL